MKVIEKGRGDFHPIIIELENYRELEEMEYVFRKALLGDDISNTDLVVGIQKKLVEAIDRYYKRFSDSTIDGMVEICRNMEKRRNK